MPISSAPNPPLISAVSCWTAPCAQSLAVGLVGRDRSSSQARWGSAAEANLGGIIAVGFLLSTGASPSVKRDLDGAAWH